MSSRITILGVPIDNLSEKQVVEKIDQFVAEKKPRQVITVNAEFLVAAQHDIGFREILHRSVLNTPDGIGVLWAAKYLSLSLTASKFWQRAQAFWQATYTGLAVFFAPAYIRSVIAEKVSGTDLIWSVSNLAEGRGYSIFLLGGFGDTPQLVGRVLNSKFPKLKIVGAHSGSPEENGVIDLIKSCRPDILFVAFGPVRQEKWIAQSLEKLAVPVVIGLGGTFDYLADKRPFAPHFLRYRGLEWAFRLVTQPKRLFRVFRAVPVFSRLVYRFKLSQTRPFRKNVVACLVNGKNQVLVCHRKDKDQVFGSGDHWQLPQGGVNNGESEEETLRREMAEETGLKKLEILGSISNAHAYDWPADLADRMYSGEFRGQAQSIYYARVDPVLHPVKLDEHEFDAHAWISKSELLDVIHPFRKELIELVVENFDRFVK